MIVVLVELIMNEIDILDKKINSSTAAILFEPIQGEGGINTFLRVLF